ncbi:hypothetical protein BRC90_06980 [Halobacteriales archaeon QS_4_69_34]|nr:MAG: hypothetical protein BRC90_06980 [Halobacteriales archaeon QS_4_69_34]
MALPAVSLAAAVFAGHRPDVGRVGEYVLRFVGDASGRPASDGADRAERPAAGPVGSSMRPAIRWTGIGPSPARTGALLSTPRERSHMVAEPPASRTVGQPRPAREGFGFFAA